MTSTKEYYREVLVIIKRIVNDKELSAEEKIKLLAVIL